MVAEIRYGLETIDHIAIPVRDLAVNQSFYVDVLGLKFKTTRRNPDGSARQTYVLAGKTLSACIFRSQCRDFVEQPRPRIGIGVDRERFRTNSAKFGGGQSSLSGFLEP